MILTLLMQKLIYRSKEEPGVMGDVLDNRRIIETLVLYSMVFTTLHCSMSLNLSESRRLEGHLRSNLRCFLVPLPVSSLYQGVWANDDGPRFHRSRYVRDIAQDFITPVNQQLQGKIRK